MAMSTDMQSTDAPMGVVDVTYMYNTGKATGMLQTTYGQSSQ